MRMTPPRGLAGVWLLAALVVSSPAAGSTSAKTANDPMHVVVMDPLAAPLACACVPGYAQRDYGRLGTFLESRLNRPVTVVYAEALSRPGVGRRRPADLVIGKFSLVVADARKAGLRVRPLAMLSGREGRVTQQGLFVVRRDDKAKSIGDLKGRRILFGPAADDEKHAAALATLDAFDVPRPKTLLTSSGDNTAAIAVVEREADAAVISSHAMALLTGCGALGKDELRIVGRTDPVPFIGVFATERVSVELQRRIADALGRVGGDAELLKAMESKDGFVRLPRTAEQAAWPDWRGTGRHATSAAVPKTLPAAKRLLWSRTMTGPAVAGLAVTANGVIVANKSTDDERDMWHCLDADTGREIWRVAYRAAGEMDFTNSPRANPVIHDGLVFLLGAFGDLHCVTLESGAVVWRRHLAKDFGGTLPQWGWSSTPLVVDDMLIVNPGAKDASLVALGARTGKTVWASAGEPPGYASFILATFGGVRQIIGYDAISLGGWDPATGKRLWRLVPEIEGDFNVPTPIVVGKQLLVATENNGTRLYAFDEHGRITPKPVASTGALIPDTSTPVVLDGLVFGNGPGLVCLDVRDRLKTLWQVDREPYVDYCSFIAGRGRVLVMTQAGRLCLVKAAKDGYHLIARLDLFDDVPKADRDVWSHPALVGNRLYVRNLLGVSCFLLE